MCVCVCVFVTLDKGAPCVIWHTAQCEVVAGYLYTHTLLCCNCSLIWSAQLLSLLRGTRAVLGDAKTWGLLGGTCLTNLILMKDSTKND